MHKIDIDNDRARAHARTHKITWIFINLFSVHICLWTHARLQQFIDRIKYENGKSNGETDWNKDFNTVVDLVESVDREIGLHILITCVIWLSLSHHLSFFTFT